MDEWQITINYLSNNKCDNCPYLSPVQPALFSCHAFRQTLPADLLVKTDSQKVIPTIFSHNDTLIIS